MKRKIMTVICIVLTMTLCATFCFSSLAMGTKDYNPSHSEKIRSFLEITDDDGIKNGKKLNSEYDPQNPATWKKGMYGFFFNESGDLSNIFILYYDFVGVLDVSGIDTMRELVIYSGRISGVDVTNCTGLESLDVGRQNITSIDGLESCIALTQANVNENQLTELHLANPNLTTLYCYENQLAEMDLGQCPSLTFISCGNNPITSLDFSANPMITQLYCSDMALNALDVSGLTHLELLWCQNNNISGSLDLTQSESLLVADITGNKLSSASLHTTWHGATVEIDSIGGGYVSFFAKDTLVDGAWTFPVICVAEENASARFIHWIDRSTGEVVSNEPSFTVERGTAGSYTAVFEPTEPSEEHLVFFVDRDGTLLSRQTVQHGGSAVAPDGPTHEYYTFTEWAGGDYSNVTCDMVLVAQYTLNMIIGDVNYNGYVEIIDAVLATRAAMNLITLDDEQLLAADFNEDMHLLVSDSVMIARLALNLG